MPCTCWIGGSFGSVPDGAVRAGRDKDGGALFVGRAYFETDILPAKIVPNHGAAYVSFDGQEHQVMHYEVLCGGEAMWQVASDGQVPTNAFPVGTTRDGERLYVGRVFHDGTITPGKVHPSHGVCYIPYDGLEIQFKEYEVLIMK